MFFTSCRLKQLIWKLTVNCTDFVPVAVGTNGPEDDLRHRGDGHHLVVVSKRPAQHLGVEGDSVDHVVEARRGEDLLPAVGFLHPDDRKNNLHFLVPSANRPIRAPQESLTCSRRQTERTPPRSSCDGRRWSGPCRDRTILLQNHRVSDITSCRAVAAVQPVTCRHSVLGAGPAQKPGIPQVGRHRVAASDRRPLRWPGPACHELRPGHTVAVPTLRWVHWGDMDTDQGGSGPEPGRVQDRVRSRTGPAAGPAVPGGGRYPLNRTFPQEDRSNSSHSCSFRTERKWKNDLIIRTAPPGGSGSVFSNSYSLWFWNHLEGLLLNF